MTLSPHVRETADRVLKSAVQGYLASWLIASGATPNFDLLFTVTNCKSAIVIAVLSAATAAGLRHVGPDKTTSQIF